jgi:hypothetical protein
MLQYLVRAFPISKPRFFKASSGDEISGPYRVPGTLDSETELVAKDLDLHPKPRILDPGSNPSFDFVEEKKTLKKLWLLYLQFSLLLIVF